MSVQSPVEVSAFGAVKVLVAERFKQLTEGDWAPFQVSYDRDDIWGAYHSAFQTPEWMQDNACSTCKSFIRAVGGIVTIDPVDLEVRSLWDFRGQVDMPEEYLVPLATLDEYVRSRPIDGLFYHTEPSAGVDKNADPKRDIVWQHFHAKIPRSMQDRDGSMVRKSAELRDARNVLLRALQELTPESMRTVLELIDQDSLYRGPEYRGLVENLQKVKEKFDDLSDTPNDPVDCALSRKALFSWVMAQEMGPANAKVRNTAIGQLLIDLSEGKKGLEGSVKSFENMVAPTNYKRPKALVTPRMVEQAKERLQELDLMEALNRRQLDSRDLTAADALFVHRPKKANKDVFDEIAGETPVSKDRLSKVEEISAKDFVEKVVPTAETMRVLFERQHLGNLVALTGPQDPKAHGLMKWDNSFAWSYTGGVADSIKERVKAAGGRVEDVWLRSSLSWYNHDDLDLHFQGKGEHVYYGHKHSSALGVRLDVDMNAGGMMSREPVENIYVTDRLPAGEYQVKVHNYTKRESNDEGFELEIEHDGEIRTYGSPISPRGKTFAEPIKFTVAQDGTITWHDCELSKSASGMTKWGLKTGQFHTVRALTTSPNHWTKPTGNKHLFFLLEGCVADEKVRPFYNEFLTDALAKERKVCEVLGGKIEVEKAEGAELSGLGFSETMRNHVYVEVEGQFKRTLKVNF